MSSCARSAGTTTPIPRTTRSAGSTGTPRIATATCRPSSEIGTPMILGGDEFLRTQRGNNNAYSQDNEISWFDWNAADRNRDMQTFFRDRNADDPRRR